jgi:hypothetical protein
VGGSSLIRRDDSEALIGRQGVLFRLVAETEDYAEAVRVAESLRRQIAAGEI